MKRIMLLLIRIYMRYISPLYSGKCRFYPSCSHYCYDAINKYGVIKGTALGIRRILKCHPFNPGGYDPLK